MDKAFRERVEAKARKAGWDDCPCVCPFQEWRWYLLGDAVTSWVGARSEAQIFRKASKGEAP